MRRAATTFLTTLALALTPLAVATGAGEPAPRPGAAGIGDPYFPLDGNGGYDVGHYGLAVSYDPGTDRLAGRAVIRARATQSLSRFDLDLVGLSVDAVSVDGAGAGWSRTTHELRITARHALRAGRSFTVVVRYHGVPRLLDEPALGRSGVFPTVDGALVVGQPHVAATWFPVNDHPGDKATYAVDVTVPRGLEAVSNGALVGRRTRGHRTTWFWRETAPMASYLATAIVGQFRLKAYRAKGLSYLDAIDPVLYEQPRPRTGGRYAISGGDDNGYKRLTRTIDVPASGGRLDFQVTRNTEPSWDYFAVEARTAGRDDWTTLPDANGHSSTDTGRSCFSWQAIHPQLGHYQSVGDQGCTASGTTGAWNAATGASDGYEHWSVDLSAYAGKKVELSLSVISDETVSYPGAWVDDIVGPGGRGSTSFEADGDPLDGWALAPSPAGSPTGVPTWTVASRDARPSVGDNAAAALAREPDVIAVPQRGAGALPVPAGRRDRGRRPRHRVRAGEPDPADLQQGLLRDREPGQRLGGHP